MRVLAVIIAHPLRKISGATNAGLQLSEAVAQHTELDLAVMWDADETLIVGDLAIRRFKCWNRLGPFSNLVPRFVRVPLYDSSIPEIIRDGDYDLVHIHNLVPTLAAARLGRACRRRGIPYVISTHGFFELSSYARINGFGKVKSTLVDWVLTRPFRDVVKGATRILALSDREGEMLAALGVQEAQIDVVTNGVNEFFLEAPSNEELEGVRKKFGINRGPVLLFMGSLHAYKGVGVFLQALSQLKYPFQAIVAGKFKDVQESEALLTAAGVSNDVRSRIAFTGGISNEDLRALYHSADVFVYPTMGDTLPLVVLEAMACGLPIVSTMVGGIPYAVPPECGILTAAGNPQATADAVTKMLSSENLRRTAGAQARARVLNTFRWNASAHRAILSYEKALRSSNPEFVTEQRVQETAVS